MDSEYFSRIHRQLGLFRVSAVVKRISDRKRNDNPMREERRVVPERQRRSAEGMYGVYGEGDEHEDERKRN